MNNYCKYFILSFLFVASFLLLINTTFCQCVPDTNYSLPGFYPDSLPTAYVNSSYNESITVVISEDTINPYFTPDNPLLSDSIVLIDSIGIDTILNVPNNMYYQMTPESNYIKGGDIGCILISGMPDVDQAGVHKLKVCIVAYVNLSMMGPVGIPDTAVFSVEILDTSDNAIHNSNFISEFNVFPNPCSHNSTLQFYSFNRGNLVVNVFNITGDLVYRDSFISEIGNNEYLLSLDNLPNGLYHYKLFSENLSIGKSVMKISGAK